MAQNLAVVEEFASRLEVLPYAKAGQHYGAIRSVLERAGQPIGINDLHIAAHARSEGLTLVTNNLGEFARVPGLLLENWVAHSTIWGSCHVSRPEFFKRVVNKQCHGGCIMGPRKL